MKKLNQAEYDALKQRSTEIFQRFTPYQEALLDNHPAMLERLNQFIDASNKCEVIPENLRHLIWIAVDSVCSHLYERGVRIHTLFAMQHGVDEVEIYETLAIACRTLLYSWENSIDIVLEETASDPTPPPPMPDFSDNAAIQNFRETAKGEAWVDEALRYSRHAFPASLGLMTPSEGVLDAKTVELINLAVEACPAVLNRQGIRRHARKAVELGASRAELVEVLELTAGIGMHAISVGMPVIQDAKEEFKVTGGKQ